jgi:hypothetical protein
MTESVSNVRPEIDFESVYGNSDCHEEVISFWKSLGVLPNENEAQTRVNQLVYVARHESRIVGVSTAQKQNIPRLNDKPFFVFRMLLHPDYRLPGLMDKMTLLTYEYLENLFIQGETECIGLFAVVENAEQNERRREAITPLIKLVFIGNTQNGHQLRVSYFKGAKI